MPVCSRCGADRSAAAPGWCEECQTGERIGSDELLAWLVERAKPLPHPVVDPNPLRWPGYRERRGEMQQETGVDEAVTAVRGCVAGTDTEAVFLAWDFRFFGGSMSSAVGQIVAGAYDEARVARLPIVLLPSTGGARMQEGMASLVQMGATAVAAQEHADAGLLQVTVLRDPTTGGVFASHANLSDVLLAEPGATIGFAGPRVAEAMTGGPLPSGSHTARGALAAGLVDGLVARPDLPAALARLVSWPGAPTPQPVAAVDPGDRERTGDAWTEVERARASHRPRAPRYLRHLERAAELHGDRAGADDGTIRVVLGRLAGRPVVMIAMDRTCDDARVTPAGYRKAWRGLRLADRLGVPVVALIDTPGADASAASEAGGIAAHIARTFQEVLAVRPPVVALVIGEGGSGGALCLAVGDRLLIQEHAVFTVIAPEGAAAILHRDASRAPEVAELQKPTAHELVSLGFADRVVPEPAGEALDTAVAALVTTLDEVAATPGDVRLRARRARWRRAGAPIP